VTAVLAAHRGMAMEWRERDGVRWLGAELPRATVAFSTRIGGVSAPPFDQLNLGILTDDRSAAVTENRHRLAAALDLRAENVLMGMQVHGAEVVAHETAQDPSPYAQPGTELTESDGHATRTVGLAPMVLVADCLPVALAGPGGVAMLHCGWRGLAAGIVERGAAAVSASGAAIGPGIGQCCYEVGPEVLEAFADLGEGIAEEPMLDLAEVARRQLRAAGIEEIESAGLCTKCNPELFYSHRRDGARSGRQAGFIWMEGG
jgi:purine-nucleoside/S-methyl-5'-thioadenosine phosphorylase / adenosine deaminase